MAGHLPSCVCREALECAKMCRDAYYVPKRVIIRRIAPDTLVVANAGTDNLYDWLANFSFKQRNNGEHSGFYFKALWNIERTGLRTKVVKPHARNIVFCGHSSGAASALMMTTIMRKELRSKDNVRVYMFGSPKIGGNSFATLVDSVMREEDFDLDVFNLRNGRDPVSTVPFLNSFMHATPLIELESSVEQTPLEDHFTTSYVRSLTDCVRDSRTVGYNGRCFVGSDGVPACKRPLAARRKKRGASHTVSSRPKTRCSCDSDSVESLCDGM